MPAPKYKGPDDKVFSRQRISRRAVLTLVGGAAGLAVIGGVVKIASSPAQARGRVTLYRDPQCSCCGAYADYLHSNGFDVQIVPTHDLELLDARYGIATDLQPCHLSLIGDYVVGGHVPINVVDRLLSEKPQITGITLPGMPTGTPGMPGEKSRPLQIYVIAKGPRKVYAVV
jgi:hypothetical protein